MAYKAVQIGASGVDMGRNIFQAESPIAMVQAVRSIVQDDSNVDKAFQLYNDLK
jgi:putative autoinducer-2 (AI-2) aldolase